MKRMVLDTSHLLFAVASAHARNSAQDPKDLAGLAVHSAINVLNKYYKKFKPGEIALIFEGRKNWRKAYTRSEKCISQRLYKGNREKGGDSMEVFFELINAFQEMVRTHSSLLCLQHDDLEGDDSFAAYVQSFDGMEDEEVIGVSGDRDFVSLLKQKNFTLINPDTGKPRLVKDVCGVDDAEYFMFEKAIRGDKGDNVFPAYPRVRVTRIKQAYEDDMARVNLFNETWSEIREDGSERVMRVGDLFEENMLLMALDRQPPEIRAIMATLTENARTNAGKFSIFHFSKFCGKYGLNQIGERVDQFGDLFSVSEAKTLRLEEKKNSVGNKLLEF